VEHVHHDHKVLKVMKLLEEKKEKGDHSGAKNYGRKKSDAIAAAAAGGERRNLQFSVLRRMQEKDLRLAIKEEKLDEIRAWIGKGVDCNSVDEDGNSCLHLACMQTSGYMVQCLLTEGRADITKLNKNQQTVLHLVKSKQVYDILMSHGAAKLIGKRDYKGQTPLHSILSHLPGKETTILAAELLPKCSVSVVNLMDHTGSTPLHYAVSSNNFDCVISLCKFGANPNFKEYLSGISPVHMAIICGFREILRYLMENCEVEMNLRDNKGNTPLHYACEKK